MASALLHAYTSLFIHNIFLVLVLAFCFFSICFRKCLPHDQAHVHEFNSGLNYLFLVGDLVTMMHFLFPLGPHRRKALPVVLSGTVESSIISSFGNTRATLSTAAMASIATAVAQSVLAFLQSAGCAYTAGSGSSFRGVFTRSFWDWCPSAGASGLSLGRSFRWEY